MDINEAYRRWLENRNNSTKNSSEDGNAYAHSNEIGELVEDSGIHQYVLSGSTSSAFNNQLEAIRAISEDLYQSFNRLNSYQQKAVFINNKKTLVSAMVGSGKTMVLVHKVLYLNLVEDVPLDRMAVITFTNKAANEIKERVKSYYSSGNTFSQLEFPYLGTFHSIARTILMNSPNIERLGYTSEFSIIDENERKDLLIRLSNEHHLDIKFINNIDKRVDRYLSYPTQNRSILYGNMKYGDDLVRLIELAKERKLSNNVMDFDDLITNVNSLLSISSDFQRPDWIIIDEFQDCSPYQIDFIDNLTDENTSVFAVGDPNQLIYTWRGSDVSIFNDFRTKDCVEYHLPVNYRSSSSILDVAKHLLSEGDQQLLGTRVQGSKVHLWRHYDSNQEAFYLAQKIQAFQNNGIEYREMAILFRMKMQSEVFEAVFDQTGIPYEISQRQSVKDIPVLCWFIKFLKGCLNPSDIDSLASVITDNDYGIVENRNANIDFGLFSARNELLKYSQKSDHYGVDIKESEIRTFLKIVNEFDNQVEDLELFDIYDIYSLLNLEYYLRPSSSKYSQDVNLIKRFLSEITFYVQNNPDKNMRLSLINAVNELSLGGYQIFSDVIDPNNNSVKLLTMHAAKGLEFRYVFISGANNGLIPLRFGKGTLEELEEEKRLFFVALTRAKDYLEISYHNNPEGWSSFPEPSIFLNEIPDHLLDKHINEAHWSKSKDQPLQEYEDFYVGQTVMHTKYGTGKVIGIDRIKMTIDFDAIGEKSFAVKFIDQIEPI